MHRIAGGDIEAAANREQRIEHIAHGARERTVAVERGRGRQRSPPTNEARPIGLPFTLTGRLPLGVEESMSEEEGRILGAAWTSPREQRPLRQALRLHEELR